MKYPAFLFLIIFISVTTFAQKPKAVKKTPPDSSAPAVQIGGEKEEFDKAAALNDAAEQIKALEKFLAAFPKSSEKNHALELMTVARAQIGDQKFKNNEPAEGVKFFTLAVRQAPQPISDKLFSEIILQIPSGLFFRGQTVAASETAQLIEVKTEGNARQTLGLATYYLGIENAAEAERLAAKALVIEPNLPAAYQTLGIAQRLNFNLDDALESYAKALELDANSAVSKRSLAEMNRAVGKPDAAVRLYRELLAKDEADAQAQTGLTLALFDAEKQTEAETEMAKSLAANASNLPLLAGAAYWYAAHNDGAQAVALASRATKLEPRYIWAQIALARGFMQQKKPLEAERVLLTARQYGNFPTLAYELAAARLQAGFFREAAETLAVDFTVRNGLIGTKLGGRVVKNSKSFVELLAPERRAGIFQPLAADSPENAERMKNLLDFKQQLDSADIDETAISQTADAFIEGTDRMKLHRQLFVARQLLDKNKNSVKVSEIAQSAIGKADAALDVPNAAAAVLADALYESRASAASRNEIVVVPEVSRPTLSAILRGEIEEIVGWSAYRLNKNDDAVVHLKRAVSVLPEKSSFWLSSYWRLGAALEADGKDKEALEAYFKGYPTDAPSGGKYLIIESLYKKINGSNDGLEARIGAKPEILGGAVEQTELRRTTVPKTETAVQAAEIAAAPENIKNDETKTETSVKPAETLTVPTETPKTAATPQQVDNAVEKSAVSAEIQPKNDSAEIAAPKINAETAPPTIENAPPKIEVKTAAPEEKSAPTEVKNEIKTAEPTPLISAAPENVPPTDKPKQLFEPIIIEVPKPETAAPPAEAKSKTVKDETKSTPAEKTSEPSTPVETARPEILRPRVIITDNFPVSSANSKCSLAFSQESVTLINNGGSLGLIGGFENPDEKSEITAISSSPNDVSVTLDEGIGTTSGRSFFIVKSISVNVGEYKITFEAACGKKEIAVKVR